MSWFKDIIKNKKKTLAKHSEGILTALAKSCVYAWNDTVELDKILQDSLSMLPHCDLIYTVDTSGELVSSNIEANTQDATLKGRVLVGRPFMETLPYNGFTMSPVYVSLHSRKSCITVMQSVTDGDKVLGFIAADFDVEKLPVDKELKKEETKWQQYKGDPAIRGTLFLQERVLSAMDKQLDNVTEIIKDMMMHHGIFHCKVHYSSSRVSFWTMENPYDYHIHMLEDLIDPERCLAYSRQEYPSIATVPENKIAEVMDMFKILRNMDETVYLRSASFNIVNGIVGLTFSCDGSHYMNYAEFLEWDLDTWFGSNEETDNKN